MLGRGGRGPDGPHGPAPRLTYSRKPVLSSLSRAAHLALALTLLGVVGVRLHRLDVPFERDEGEFAYMAQLILQGEAPFESAYNMKLPGTYYAYAAILALGGESTEAVHAGLLALNLAAAALVYALGRRLLGPAEAALAAAAYALLSLEPTVLGFFAHATHFVVVPALAGLLLLLAGLDARRPGVLFAAGVLLGAGVLMKQHGIAFVALAFATLLARVAAERAGWRPLVSGGLTLGLGTALPYALLCLHLLQRGVFDTFWHWTVVYAREYVSAVSPGGAIYALWLSFGSIVLSSWPLWLAAVLGAWEVARREERRRSRAFLAAFGLFSALAVTPGFYFRPHYFVLLLPAASLFCGVGLLRAAELLAPRLRAPAAAVLLAGLAAMLGAGALRRAPELFSYTADQTSHAVYQQEFFPEIREVGLFLRERADPEDAIAVIGSEPQIYFYARRRSASGYLYTYPLMEPQPFASEMQRRMAAEVERAEPRFAVFVNHGSSWSPWPNSDRYVFAWAEGFLEDYRPIACYALRREGRSRFVLGEAWRGIRPPRIVVYERRGEEPVDAPGSHGPGRGLDSLPPAVK